jgi:hypothetical protein
MKFVSRRRPAALGIRLSPTAVLPNVEGVEEVSKQETIGSDRYVHYSQRML